MLFKVSEAVLPILASLVGFSSLAGAMHNIIADMEPNEVVSEYFEVHNLTACRDVDTILFEFDRTIYRPIEISPTVRLMVPEGAGWREYGSMSRPAFTYRPEAELPASVDWAWWAWGEIHPLPDGPMEVWTDWTPRRDDLDAISFRTPVAPHCEEREGS